VKTEADSASASRLVRVGKRPVVIAFLWYWLPLFVWMVVIFGFSTDAGSTRHTSRFIGPTLRWLFPDISDESIRVVQLVVRKTAHMVEYGVLALLAWRAHRRPFPGDTRLWRRSEAGLALGMATLFAISDEWHQSYVPSRQGQLTDVLIDMIGATLGLLTLWSWGRYRKRW
jgi:VanZ family protein